MKAGHPDIEQVIFTPRQIEERVSALGKRLQGLYRGKNPLYVCVLKGAVVFLADLIRAVEDPVEIDFMDVSSYGMETRSSGIVRIVKDLDTPIKGRHVIIVEDIIDSGRTLHYLIDLLEGRQVESLRVIPLLLRPGYRGMRLLPEDYGFLLPPGGDFVVGYGLDYAKKYRGLPYIGILKPAVFQA